jgi:hypothetical protein
MSNLKQRIGKLEDDLKQRDERIAELRDEVDEQRELIRELEQHVKERDEYMEGFIATFGMQLGADNCWDWEDSAAAKQLDKLTDDYNGLVKEYNEMRESFLYAWSKVHPGNIGRPLAASDAQKVEVLKQRKLGSSLREIAADTNLSVRTVRTIVSQSSGTDRTTRKHRARLQPTFEVKHRVKDKGRMSRTTLPKRATAHLENGRELLKQAKGLGRVRAGS